MQSKGAIRLVAILLVIASLWQLTFTLVSSYQKKKAVEHASVVAEAIVQSTNVAEQNRQAVLDSVTRNRQAQVFMAKTLFAAHIGHMKKKQGATLELDVTNLDRAFGTIFGSRITRLYGEKGLPEDSRLYLSLHSGYSLKDGHLPHKPHSNADAMHCHHNRDD